VLQPAYLKQNISTGKQQNNTRRACASPVVAGNLIIGTSGFVTAEKNVIAIRPEYSDNSATASEVYRISKAVPHVPTPLIYRDWMFLWTERGIVSCVEFAPLG